MPLLLCHADAAAYLMPPMLRAATYMPLSHDMLSLSAAYAKMITITSLIATPR